MATSVTLKELARLLHLAPSTVSRALKGHPDISKATQERVIALARQLQYRPNPMAAGLRNHRFGLICVIVPLLTNYFYASVVHGIMEHVYAKKYKVVVFESLEDNQREAAICFSLHKAGIDGLLVCPAKTTEDPVHFEMLKKEALPLVFFDRILGSIDTDRVIGDNYSGAYLAVSHLIEKGCRNIAHLAINQKWLWAQKRQIGYVQALLEHHLPVNRQLIVEYRDLNQIEAIVNRLYEQHHIDGLFAVEDVGAVEALTALRRAGRCIPKEVAICGYGNDPVSSATYPALTTVDGCGRQIGQVAAEFLIRRIEEENKGETETKLLKSKLIVRESTDIRKGNCSAGESILS